MTCFTVDLVNCDLQKWTVKMSQKTQNLKKCTVEATKCLSLQVPSDISSLATICSSACIMLQLFLGAKMPIPFSSSPGNTLFNPAVVRWTCCRAQSAMGSMGPNEGPTLILANILLPALGKNSLKLQIPHSDSPSSWTETQILRLSFPAAQ